MSVVLHDWDNAAADRVVDEVDATAVGQLGDFAGEIGRLVVDRVIGAGRAGAPPAPLRSGRPAPAVRTRTSA
jgi:hypothetical protein